MRTVALGLCLLAGAAFGQARPPVGGDMTFESITVTDTGPAFIMPADGKFCLNGSACTNYFLFDGTNAYFREENLIIPDGALINSNATSLILYGDIAMNALTKIYNQGASSAVAINDVDGLCVGNGTGVDCDGSVFMGSIAVQYYINSTQVSVGALGITGNGTNFLFINPGSTGGSPAGTSVCFGDGSGTTCDGAISLARINPLATLVIDGDIQPNGMYPLSVIQMQGSAYMSNGSANKPLLVTDAEGLQLTAAALPTCVLALVGTEQQDVAAVGAGERSRRCLCTHDGAGTAAGDYDWVNQTSGTVGTETTCSP